MATEIRTRYFTVKGWRLNQSVPGHMYSCCTRDRTRNLSAKNWCITIILCSSVVSIELNWNFWLIFIVCSRLQIISLIHFLHIKIGKPNGIGIIVANTCENSYFSSSIQSNNSAAHNGNDPSILREWQSRSSPRGLIGQMSNIYIF